MFPWEFQASSLLLSWQSKVLRPPLVCYLRIGRSEKEAAATASWLFLVLGTCIAVVRPQATYLDMYKKMLAYDIEVTKRKGCICLNLARGGHLAQWELRMLQKVGRSLL